MFFPRGKFAQWTPVMVQGDNDVLARENERLLIYFPKDWRAGDPVITRLAPVGIITAGWVVGIREVGTNVSDNGSPNLGE